MLETRLTLARPLENRFFRTGDLGRMEDDTYLRITGRIKEQYKLENGKYVVPGPIEAAMTSSTYITQVCNEYDGCEEQIFIFLIGYQIFGGFHFSEDEAFSAAAELAFPTRHSMVKGCSPTLRELRGLCRPSAGGCVSFLEWLCLGGNIAVLPHSVAAAVRYLLRQQCDTSTG